MINPKQILGHLKTWALVSSIKEKLMEAEQYASRRLWERWCIYQVPQYLKDAQENKKAYVPKTLSIGPHHLGSEQVQDMVIHKQSALKQRLGRTDRNLKIDLDSIKEIEQDTRDCYQQNFRHVSSNDFVEMMLLDGCFIAEFLRSRASNETNRNPVFSDQRIFNDILLDMVMLENQIPLSVIHKLFGVPGEYSEDQVVRLILSLFNPEWLTGIPMNMIVFNEMRSSLQHVQCLHVLDVFRQSLIYAWPQLDTVHRPEQVNETDTDLRGVIIHRVTDLIGGGVKFSIRDSNCFGDIRFNNGVLEIPTIKIHDSTMTILLNVAAFEYCHLNISDAKIASYLFFMQCLIKSPEDVSHLHHCGVIQNILGADAEVVDMFQSIPKEILVDPHGGYYGELSKEVNEYYNHRRNRWRASLFQKYLDNPWTIISLVAASILLILTSIQSFYAVYAYYRPKS